MRPERRVAQPAEPPTEAPPAGESEATRYLRPGRAANVLEWLILICLLAAAATVLLAGPPPDADTRLSQPVGLFFRAPLAGYLAPAGQVVPWAALLGLAGLVLAVQALLPRLRPDVRGGTAAFAYLLLLVPVLNFDAQRDALTVQPMDLLPGMSELSSFNPILPPISYLLAAAAVLVAVWFVVVPKLELPPAAKGFGLVTLLIGLGGAWLNHYLIQARGNALQLDYYQWPYAMESLAVLVHLGLAATACGALGRDGLRSRVFAGLTALLSWGIAAWWLLGTGGAA